MSCSGYSLKRFHIFILLSIVWPPRDAFFLFFFPFKITLLQIICCYLLYISISYFHLTIYQLASKGCFSSKSPICRLFADHYHEILKLSMTVAPKMSCLHAHTKKYLSFPNFFKGWINPVYPGIKTYIQICQACLCQKRVVGPQVSTLGRYKWWAQDVHLPKKQCQLQRPNLNHSVRRELSMHSFQQTQWLH